MDKQEQQEFKEIVSELKDETKKSNDTETFVHTLDKFNNIVAMASGYKNRLVEAGFSEISAEEMAIDMHRLILAKQR